MSALSFAVGVEIVSRKGRGWSETDKTIDVYDTSIREIGCHFSGL